MLPEPVRMTGRASGRRRLSAEITSRPLPSPSRMSTTANAGEEVSRWIRPSATDSAVVTVKPRPSMARASRCRNDLSSSTIRRVRSPVVAVLRFSTIVLSVLSTVFSTRIAIVFASSAAPLDAKSGKPKDLQDQRQWSQSFHARSIVYIHGAARLTTAKQGKFLSIYFAGLARGEFGAAQCWSIRECVRRLLEVATAPAHAHHGPARGRQAVLELERRAGAFQQRLGDEEAQPKTP